MDHTFALGYDPVRASTARQAMLKGRYATVKAAAPKSPAKSLTQYRRRSLQQGQAGTCWAHAPTQHSEFMMRLRGSEGFDTCRRLVAWQGKQYEGGGNPTNGGSGVDAYRALAEVGVAHESLCPYSDASRTLATRPGKAIFDDASNVHLTTPIDVQSLDDVVTLIDGADTPSAIGIWWPYGWDDQQTFMTTVGRGEYGHELLIVGYALEGTFDQQRWLQIDNWHGDLYPVLHPAFAAKVPGYATLKSDNTSDFWVEWSTLQKVIDKGNAEINSATDITGLQSDVIALNSADVFPL